MGSTAIHREDVKAILRKRYGSVRAFSSARGVNGQQVRDLLRGKSGKARAVVATELGVEPDQLVITQGKLPLCGSDSSKPARTHRLNGAAK